MSPAAGSDPGHDLDADLDGAPDADAPDPVEVRVYVFSGPQLGGLFTVPESWCRECDLFARAADQAAGKAKEQGVPVRVKVLPWWSRLLGALRYGGWHPPVLVVNGSRIAQGHDVPSVERVVEAIEAAARELGHLPERAPQGSPGGA